MSQFDQTGEWQQIPLKELQSPAATADLPQRIGRYRVEKLLGYGGFGLVYLAHDDDLQRLVAIKVAHSRLISQQKDAEPYLAEARIVASLDHPNIVPVWDVGSTAQFPCYVVSKFIDGSTLARKMASQGLSITEAAELIAVLADALHYAHGKGIYHRDVKPGNILLDAQGRPYLSDFGLALKEENKGRGPKYCGTPAYMSPEQARGEGNRLDGRSDIFSLAVVFYELLTHQRPFKADSQGQLLEMIATAEPRPPRQIVDCIPRELERICLRALSKRAVERYTTARDLADDLRHFYGQPTAAILHLSRQKAASDDPASSARTVELPPATPHSDQQLKRIVPKGLRSFDESDSDFFLELLPGPRDRLGLPDSIRFWKSRIESLDRDTAFCIGLLYGPSGCGKSSLVKAGLLPLLAKHVTPIYIEASALETESRLLAGLRRRYVDLQGDFTLKDTLAALRQGECLAPTEKVLIVLDQFEQWLHAHKGESNTELVLSLRQCDGARVQCLVIVRDDFWLAITRFLRELEIDLLQSQNSAVVDLFDIDHAGKVLAALGRAFGKLPANQSETSKEQKEFLKQAVAGLSQDGKVICVRLALFAEMVKGKPWLPETLKAAGGMSGVGVSFLEETFCSRAANPSHRLHQKAVRAVLAAMLPEAGANIKGNLRSRQELMAASGYADQPREFEDLIHILDRETRLITPGDPEGQDPGSGKSPDSEAGQGYYQLTHDYLVPVLRDWLTRKQKETWRGRAEIRLAERTGEWTARPEKRNLPSPIEWARIRAGTRSQNWTPPQRSMMRRADVYYLSRFVMVTVFLVLAGWGFREYKGQIDARALRDRLLSAAFTEVPTILKDINRHRQWVDPMLREAHANAVDPNKKVFLSLALLGSDSDQVTFLYDSLFHVAPEGFAVIRRALVPHQQQLTELLWEELTNLERDSDRRFRAACALAEYSPKDPKFTDYSQFILDKLIAEDAFALSHWMDALEPVRDRLLPAIVSNIEGCALGAAGERRILNALYFRFAAGEEGAIALLEKRLLKGSDQASSAIVQAKQKANVATALLALRRGEKVWPLLVHGKDPTIRSFLIEMLGSSGIDAKQLKVRFDSEKDVSARRALILALGGFQLSDLPELPNELMDLYQNDADPGIHSASGWLLGRWGRREQLRSLDERLATGRIEPGRKWYSSRERLTFVILREPSPKEVSNGNPGSGSTLGLAMAATEVTVAQFLAFRPNHGYDTESAPTPDCPVNLVSWYDAAEYCNWLSKRDGIPENQWYYQRTKDGTLTCSSEYKNRTGYRLPTEAEWEFACRAGAQPLWSFGEADADISGKYAWWFGNAREGGKQKSFPVGLLKPNDWGLFDMHGNVGELCLDSASPPKGEIFNDLWSSGRGGYYFSEYQRMECTSRFDLGRKNSFKYVGFRPARTLHSSD